MAWVEIAIPSGGDVMDSTWGNNVKADLEASQANQAQAAGDVFTADGHYGWTRHALGASGNILTADGTYVSVLDKAAFGYEAAYPTGSIIIWSGSIGSIPANWALCNGSNGTPDLRDRFVLGAMAGYFAQGETGGSTSVTYSHTHTGTVSLGAHQHTGTTANWANNNPNTSGTKVAVNNGSGLQPQSAQVHYHGVSASGGSRTYVVDGPHSHAVTAASASWTADPRPPYYALAYIMRTS